MNSSNCFELFESGSVVEQCHDNHINKWITNTHLANPFAITSETVMFGFIKDLYTGNDYPRHVSRGSSTRFITDYGKDLDLNYKTIEHEYTFDELASDYRDSYKSHMYYNTIKDDVECRKEHVLSGFADIYYIASLYYRFKSQYIRDFVIDYIAHVYENAMDEYDNGNENTGYTITYDIPCAIIVGYDKFAEPDDNITIRRFIQDIINRGIHLDGKYYSTIIMLYMSYNEDETTVGQFIMSRNAVEVMFEIGHDEHIIMEYDEKNMLKHAYIPLNKECNPACLNDLQTMILKTIVFIYGVDCDTQKNIDELVEAYKKCASPMYINHLLEYINESDCNSILDDLISIARSYMLRNDHFIVLGEDYKEGTIKYRTGYEFNELCVMATEDENDILNDMEDKVRSLIADIIRPFDFDI